MEEDSVGSDKWQPVAVVTGGEVLVLDGVNIWDAEWTPSDPKSVEVSHPSYPEQRHLVHRYTLAGRTRVVEFAAGELSASVWGVIVPCDSSDPH